jgi:hypothetical protein
LSKSIEGSAYNREDNILIFRLDGRQVVISNAGIGLVDVFDKSEVERLMGKIAQLF